MTVRMYRGEGTSRLFRSGDVIENEPGLTGFRLAVAEVFPQQAAQP